MRVLVRELITGHEPLTDLIPADRWKSSGSVSEENVPERKFATIRYGTFARGLADVRRGSVTFWIHDDPGTYGGIDDVIQALTDRLDGVTQHSDGSGNEIMQMTWQGNSGDLYDPGFRTIVKNCSFELIGKGL